MKKYSFILLAGLLAGKSSYAQTFTTDVTINSSVPANHAGGYRALWFPYATAVMPENALDYAGIALTSNVIRSASTGWAFADATKPAWRLFMGHGSVTDYFHITRSGPNNYSAQTLFYIKNTGSIGIGTSNPLAKLDVAGDIAMAPFAQLSSFRASSNSYTNLFLGGGIKYNNNGTYTVATDGASNYFAAIRMDATGGNVGAINFYTGSSVSGSNYDISNGDMYKYKRMAIVGDRVGIGTESPDERLTVYGNIHARGVRVDLSGPLADYVFKPDYKLAPLSSVDAYVKKYHHLPEIPSAEQVEKEGLNLGVMNEKLLKKVEELTLYLIEQNKRISKQDAFVRKQANRIRLLERKAQR